MYYLLQCRYQGSFVESHGRVMLDLDENIARVLRAFGALKMSCFLGQLFIMTT